MFVSLVPFVFVSAIIVFAKIKGIEIEYYLNGQLSNKDSIYSDFNRSFDLLKRLLEKLKKGD